MSQVVSPLADMVACNGISLRELECSHLASVRNSRNGSDEKKVTERVAI